MWFDEIMDDCKKSLQIAGSRKGIFAPIFIRLALDIMLGLYFIVSIVAIIISFASNSRLRDLLGEDGDMALENIREIFGILSHMWIWLLISYLLVLAVSIFMEAGVIGMLKAAVDDRRPRSTDFLGSIKQSFFKILGGKVFLQIISLILSPIIILVFLLIAFTVGILSAGWATIFLTATVAVYFSTWTIAVTIDGIGPIKAIGMSFKLGKRYFKGLFLIILSATVIISYIATAFGLIIAMLAGWFIVGVITTIFKLIIVLIYERKKAELLGIKPELMTSADSVQ